MDYGIKVSRKDAKGKHKITHILLVLAIPYLNGAKKQIDRYAEAASGLEQDPINSVNDCLHEASCLFEDLATIAKYTKLCQKEHSLNNLWEDIRNHIRHDIRENFGNDDARKKKRLTNLGVKSHLQTSMGFDNAKIKIGETTIKLKTIEEYLEWATGVINSAIEDAEKRGGISK